MRLPLLKSDDPGLRQVASAITDPTAYQDLVEDLWETMAAEGGVGLAAPQVGQSLRLFVTGVKGEQLACFNPTLVTSSEKRIPWEEGCLSLPRLLGEVIRPAAVTLEYQDAAGQTCQRAADDLLARVFQHELDHLDGILFPDRISDKSKLRTITEKEWQSRFEANQSQQPE